MPPQACSAAVVYGFATEKAYCYSPFMSIRKLAKYFRGLQEVAPVAARDSSRGYDDRVLTERQFFSGCQTQNELPEIYHYWSNKYLRPKLERLGFPHPDEMFNQYFARAYVTSPSKVRRFLSIGTGGCRTEVTIAKHLVDLGLSDFVIECVDLNPALLAEGRVTADENSVGQQIVTVEGDANDWEPAHEYDGILANSSLHHIVNLERLFEGIEASLAPTGTFVTSDMIGRNGHMRWPEALAIVHELWRELPKEYTYNHLLRRHEEIYENWDCSAEGFEGIRAQDILPLLLRHFDFDVFVPFGNVISPFVERTFGPNFKISNPWDTRFIDRVHARDEAEIARGAIKPTHLVAAMCVGRPGAYVPAGGLTPRFCVRPPLRAPSAFREPLDERTVRAPALEAEEPLLPDLGSLVDLKIFPSDPKGFEQLFARLTLLKPDDWRHHVASVRQDSSGIHIALSPSDSECPPRTAAIDVQLGQFPPGPLTVSIHDEGMATDVSVTVELAENVRAAGSPYPQANYTDMWWNPNESGWGMSIQQHASGRLLAVWLVYDEMGAPTWYSLQPGAWSDATTYAGPIYTYTGARSTDAFIPDGVAGEIAGAGVLTFSDFANGTFSYQIGEISAVRKFTRMEF